jgi:hypothetical protein
MGEKIGTIPVYPERSLVGFMVLVAGGCGAREGRRIPVERVRREPGAFARLVGAAELGKSKNYAYSTLSAGG